MAESNGREENGPPVDLPVCAPGCDCGKTAGSRRFKLLVSLLVLLAAGGILAFKALQAKKPPANAGGTFAIPPVGQTVLGPTGLGQGGTATGGVLESLAALNAVAANQDAVLVLVPSREGGTASGQEKAAVDAVLRALKGKGVRAGFYTLSADSFDYGRVAAQVSLPAVVALTKGRGMGTASGPLTEEKVMQAYVASTQASGCCPSSGGASAACPP